MPITLEQLRSKILTSIRGRRFGLDKDGFTVGSRGDRLPVVAATSDTTATALPNHGYVSVVTTTNDGWTLTDPVPGGVVTLFCGSSSTGTHAVVPAAATIISTNGIVGSSISLNSFGSITLVGVTTAQWAQVSRSSSATAYVSS